MSHGVYATDGSYRVTVVSGSGEASSTVAIDQSTPGTTNAVKATNLPTTVDSNSGNKSASTLRVVLATDQPSLSNALSVSQSGTWTDTVTQGTAANLNATVVGTGTFATQAAQSGTWNITNVSGTVSLPTGAATSANQTSANSSLSTIATNSANTAVTQSTAASLNATVVGTGTFATQATQSGTWNVTNVSGTVSLPTGASTSALQTTGNTSLSTIATNTTNAGTPTLQSGSTTTVTQATASNLNTQSVGSIASGSTDSGNPLKVGAKYNSTLPTFTDGQRGDLQIGTKGSLNVTLTGMNGAASPDIQNASDADTNSRFSLYNIGRNSIFNATTWDRQRSITGADGTGLGIMAVSNNPNSSANSTVSRAQTSTASGSLVVKGSAGNFWGLNAASGASALYVMLFDATSAPADGTVTPIKVWTVPINSSLEIGYNPPIRCTTGITLVAPTTGPFTKTVSATAFLSGDYV